MSASSTPVLQQSHSSLSHDDDDVEQLLFDTYAKKRVNADEILAQLGSRNRYILFITFLVSLGWTIGAMPNMCSAFIVDSVDCKNDTNCEPENRSTIASEYGLTGERKYLADGTTSAFMLGNMLGASTITHISDRIGRRPVLIVSLIGLTLSGFVSVFADSIHVVTLGRLLQGICAPGLCLVVWVLGYECIPITLRGYSTLIYGTMWVIGYCALAPIAYYLTNWRLLLLASTLPACILAVFVVLFVPESLHFLVVNLKNEEAVRWVKRAQRFGPTKPNNKIDKMLEALFISTPKLSEPKESLGIDEFLSKKLFIFYTLILTFLWTSDTFVYFGLSLYVTRIAGNKYWNYALSGLIEMPAYIFAPPALDHFGRKPVVAYTHFLAGFSLIGFMFVPNGMIWMGTTLWMIGKFAISCSFMCIFVYGSEVFPTTIRNVCLGLCLVIARLGGIVAPHVKLLEAISASMPMVFFGSIAVAAGALTLFLPETKNRALPSSLNDVLDGKQ